MTTIDPDTRLGVLVTDHPQVAATLERLGLDYCCGGDRTLADACAAKGLDGAAVVSELGASVADEEPADWSTMTPAELVDHVVATHHRYLWDEMPRLLALAEKVESVHGDRHPELHEVRQLVDAICLDLEPHLTKEELVLFPMIRELHAATAPPQFHCGSLANPIAVMERDHDRVGELLAALHRATAGYTVPDDGCASYRAFYEALSRLESDTHLHVHKENNVLFPKVVEIERRRGA